ncbi:hypothetical protein AYO49_00575 [Verrucomicrobiaceae bacterium SCGC AG-212-N21]|nr:hypothetical protein AYO49_00575 [Verrucomicrobiaceae bacterium SCGC AG-212-N21]
MKFRITQSPDVIGYSSGTVLTLEQAAQLLELNAKEMAVRSRMAAAVMDQGFRFEIEREPGDWEPEEEN